MLVVNKNAWLLRSGELITHCDMQIILVKGYQTIGNFITNEMKKYD